MATVTTFDVFLSHNSRDKDTVERIAGCGTWDQLVRRIDARARRHLTPAERATFVQ